MFAGFSIDFHGFPVIDALNMNETVSDDIDWKIHNCFLSQNKLKSLNKILPLVLVLSISLIIGNQAAYAQTTDVWGLYCEENPFDLANMGAKNDANAAGTNGGSDVTTCPLFGNVGGNIIRIPWADNPATPITYKSISEKNTIDNDPDIKVQCFANAPDPDGGDQFEWNFGGSTVPWDCIDNFRADEDLGIGVDDPALSNQPLEVQNGQLVALNIKPLRDAGYGSFMFIISSNSPDEEGWLGTSSLGPTGTLTEMDVSVVGIFPGCDTGPACANNDAYISINNLEDWLYYKQTGSGRDNLIQQIKATIPPDVVGGHGGPIDKTALMVTGAQLSASWMIPVLISAIGIGVFVVTRKS